MSGEVYQDIRNVFEQIGINATDEGYMAGSVYRLSGTYDYSGVHMVIDVLHYYWPHFSRITISEVKLPGDKIPIAYELANRINEILEYDRFIIIPETGKVQLGAGFYSGMVDGSDEDEDEFNDNMDGYSYGYFRMIIYQMIYHFHWFSPLFKTLAKTDKIPYEIIEEFWQKIPKKHKIALQEHG